MKKLLCSLAVMASMLFTAIPMFASDIDRRIESSAQKTYAFKTYLKDDNIKIKSKNGVVTLTGTVRDASHKSLAEETAAGIPGVKSVVNKLEEKGKNHPAKKDLADKDPSTENGIMQVQNVMIVE